MGVISRDMMLVNRGGLIRSREASVFYYDETLSITPDSLIKLPNIKQEIKGAIGGSNIRRLRSS